MQNQIFNYKNDEPLIDEQAYIADGAKVIGNVKIARTVSVWFNAVIRGDENEVTIDEESNIQDLVCIHVDEDSPTHVGKRVTVGHSAILHGCTIGDGSLIGMGSTILNQATIGKDCLIGANALVTANMKIPERSLVLGSHAKVIRQLSDSELKSIKSNLNAYLKLTADYLAM